MYIIGITGGTGSGKTSAVEALKKLGAEALDCDEIYHGLLISCDDLKAEIIGQFGDVSTDGEVDRRKLSEIVWNDPAALRELNRITFKYMDAEVDSLICELKQQEQKVVAIDAIALIESGQSLKCDVVVGVVASQEKRIKRIMSRDNLTIERAQSRINAQQPESFYRSNCDYIIENTYISQDEFDKKCIDFFGDLLCKDGV